MKERSYSGVTCNAEREYEKEHRALARRCAAEGMVLLKNDGGILPLREKQRIALYGSGASKTIKGGTGSGDVNERAVISILSGLKNAGLTVTTEEWIASYDVEYETEKNKWKEHIWQQAEEAGNDMMKFFDIYCNTKFVIPVGAAPKKTDTDTALYVISRVAGEGADRFFAENDYLLSVAEKNRLSEISACYKNIIVILNTGGPMDLSFLEEFPKIQALVYMLQPGMEAGNALADVLLGKITPCGKLTDSLAFSYQDYPGAKTFSHNNGNVESECYEEGIYVGYRYFDSFDKKVRYPFGFGMSYTDFSIQTEDVRLYCDEQGKMRIEAAVRVKNEGSCKGKEVVQVYVSLPVGRLEKEYRRLAAFGKTKELMPGEAQTFALSFPLYALSSYDEGLPGWVLEHGTYGIWVGNSIADAALVAKMQADQDAVFEKTQQICVQQENIKELSLPEKIRQERYEAWLAMAEEHNVKTLFLDTEHIKAETVSYGKEELTPQSVCALVETLSEEQRIALVIGDPKKGQGSNLGAAGVTVPGSAGETSDAAKEEGIAGIVLADGPAGLRLNTSYQVEKGEIVAMPFEASIEHGFLCRDEAEKKGTTYYQYCTAFPIGTLLAQTWDIDLLERVGAAVGEEMQEFGVTLWLAPGMNLHRNPLCGRNFEYYSEDPLLSGMMAAAMTNGVQSEPGCGTTIKHFACNNQEDNRMHSNSIVSERTLREIYLKGFEIAVKSSQPMAIMTSYNKINGVHSANNYDLCTKAARDEWGFAGIIMTDWTTTNNGQDCTAAGCIRAGNDLIMPGMPMDAESIKTSLKEGTLTQEELEKCVKRLTRLVLLSNQYEEAQSYTKITGTKMEFVKKE